MLFPLSQLLEGRQAPICAKPTETIQTALDRMIEHDFSQLPVVNEQGNLLGFVSEQSIVRRYYNLTGADYLLSLSVEHCMVPATTHRMEDDLFDALNSLKDRYAITIVDDDDKIAGVLTNYDTTYFFKDITEGQILVQDIELTLRQYIEKILPTDELRQAAIANIHSTGHHMPDFEKMSFGNCIHFITAESQWDKFADFFAPKEMFARLMENVREIRNQLAHFRGKESRIQLEQLADARIWLENRPRPQITVPVQQGDIKVETLDNQPAIIQARRRGKYDALKEWLADVDPSTQDIRLFFADIEKILGKPLPPTSVYRFWWANDNVSRSQSKAWLGAGWKVVDIDFATKEAIFQRLKQPNIQDQVS